MGSQRVHPHPNPLPQAGEGATTGSLSLVLGGEGWGEGATRGASELRIAALFALLVALLPCTASAQFNPLPNNMRIAPADPAVDGPRFLEWAALATSVTVSPAKAEPGDITKRWKAPDGREIRLVVKRPHPRPDAPVVTMATVPENEDARPAFDAAMAQVRARSAGRLVIPKGIYHFRSIARLGTGHALIEDVSDLTIDGQGATFVFSMNQPGIFVTRSRRVAVTGLTLDSALHITSSATVVERDGQNVLVVDPEFPVTERDPVHYISEYDVAGGKWLQGGQTLILDPGSTKVPAVFLGAQTYTSAAFKSLRPGTRALVYHYWYGSATFRINDVPGPNQTEDIVIDGVTFRTSPGFGVFAYGMRRGLAIVNSTIAAKPGSRLPISTTYDAIHVIGGSGDIQIAGNRIANHGDDSINLDSAVHPVVSLSEDGRTLRLSKHSRLIAQGDELAFFDRSARYLGKARVVAKPKPLGGPDTEVVIDRKVPGVEPLSVARDLAIVSSRFDVSNNIIEDCGCHALVAQLPNGIAENNVMRNLAGNAIRLLADVGYWAEGVGAFNIIVRGNRISNTGIDRARMAPWAAITAYGGAHGGAAVFPVNKDLEISDNLISDAKQGCITVSSSVKVTVARNVCDSTNTTERGQPSLNVLNSTDVTLIGNRRSGATTGGQRIKATSDSPIAEQADY